MGRVNVPWAKAYAPNVLLVVLTLFPGLINSGALDALALPLAKSLHAPPAILALAPGLSDALFAFGIVLAAELVRRRDLRPLYLTLLAGDALVLLCMGLAQNALTFLALNTLNGLFSGMFLIVALPPLFVNFSESKFPISGGVLVPGLFGAIMFGPLIAGTIGTGELWRILFFGDALFIAIGFVIALLSVAHKDPPTPEAPVDWYALILTFAGIVFIFTGTLGGGVIPLAIGIAVMAVMLVSQYVRDESLIPIKRMLIALPVIGFIASAAGNAIFVADQRVFSLLLTRGLQWSPKAAGTAVWPEIVMSLVAGIAFAVAVKTTWLPRMMIAGLCLLIAGSAGMFVATSPPHPSAAIAIGSMIAFSLGSGLTVTPGLFLAGLSVEQQLVARGIAAVELLRLTIGFVTGPGAQHAIVTHSSNTKALSAFIITGDPAPLSKTQAVLDVLAGMHWTAAYATIAGIAAAACAAIMLRRYIREPQKPDLRAYVQDGTPAFASPPL